MKFIAFWASTLVFWSSISVAQTLPREALIGRIESIYIQTTMLSADSPFIEMFIGSAKSANPGVDGDTWSGIKQEITPMLSKVMTEKGGLMDVFLRKSLENFSDAELEKLSQILSNPIYNKFQIAMASPSTQRELVQALFGYTLNFNAVINSVLVKHGLNEVH